MNGFPAITVLTLLPLLGGIIVIGLNPSRPRLARGLAFLCSLAALAFALGLWFSFDRSSGAFQFGEQHEWITSLAVQYRVGVDGLGVLMLLLTALVVPMAMLASWNVSERASIYFALVLFLEAGLFGTFTALNFFHWFLYWELSIVPAFFLIRLWGGAGRVAAANQFFIYTMVGSIALLLSFLAIRLATDSFDFPALAAMARDGSLNSKMANYLGWKDLTSKQFVVVIFVGAFLGFAVKTPLVPFHTWLPAAYSEAPAGTTMLLTGLMSKMGVYGFVRILLPLFREQINWLMTPLLWLAVITIVYSASAAFAQRDLRRILAYSSINHLGYCFLAILAAARFVQPDAGANAAKAAALDGVFLQMFNHGLTAALLFWFVDWLENRSGGLRGLYDFGGLRKVVPIYCGFTGIALFASLGLPGLNGFIGEFLIFRGAFPLVTWASALSVLGLLLTAVFILTLLQRVFFGPLNQKWSQMPDLSFGEVILFLPGMALLFLLGLYPQAILGVVNSTAKYMVQQFGP